MYGACISLSIYIYTAGRRGHDDDGRRVLSADSPPVTVPRILYIYAYIGGRPSRNTVAVRSRGMIVKQARKPSDPCAVYICTCTASIHTSVPP